MTAPSQYLRELREGAARRRLELAKLLRDDPKITNIELAKALNVTRNTIAEDRKAIMEQMTNNTLTETELMRAAMVKKLESLEAEVQLHRKDGKLPLSAIDQILSITKAVIELTGVRKPVVEKVDVRERKLVQFQTVIVPTRKDNRLSPPSPNHEWSEEKRGWLFKPPIADAEVITEPEPLALKAGE